MSSRSVAQKMGIKAGWRARLIGAPPGVAETLELPPLDLPTDDTGLDGLTGDYDYLHLFVRSAHELRETLPTLVPHLAAAGKMWVSWPKARKLGTDLTLPTVIGIGYGCGLVESTCLRIDDTWSGLRFTHPRAGKVYANSYGTLPAQRS